MRKFIVSDLHGNGNIYDSIMAYLDNISKEEDVILYINGDLIDRGEDSLRMLIDVKNRVLYNNSFKIEYLGGNHELMMYQTFNNNNTREEFIKHLYNWLKNGGDITEDDFKQIESMDDKKEILRFISNLKIYKKFDEKLNDKNIVLVHAKCPNEVFDECSLKIKDNTELVTDLVWTRKINYKTGKRNYIGNNDYFTIVGHTPVNDIFGFEYYDNENVLNIDGGCAAYAKGFKDYNHTPLVEIDSKNNRLIILTFNNDNKIEYGNYFYQGKTIPMNEDILEYYRRYLNSDIKIKKIL